MADKHRCVYTYTVLSIDDTSDEPIDGQVVGSYRKREDAVEACTDYIMERMVLRPDIRYAFMNDECHNSRQVISERSMVPQGRLKKMFSFSLDDWEMPKAVEAPVRDYIRNVLEGGVYHMSTDMDSDIGSAQFIFKIQENPIS